MAESSDATRNLVAEKGLTCQLPFVSAAYQALKQKKFTAELTLIPHMGLTSATTSHGSHCRDLCELMCKHDSMRGVERAPLLRELAAPAEEPIDS